MSHELKRQVVSIYAQLAADASFQMKQNWSDWMQEISDFLEKPNVVLLAQGPRSCQAALKNVLLQNVQKATNKSFYTFVQLVLEHGRIGLFPWIKQSYCELFDLKQNVQRACVTVASKSQEAEAKKKVEAICNASWPKSHIECMVKVDPKILGGFYVKVGHRSLDATVQGVLETMKNSVIRER